MTLGEKIKEVCAREGINLKEFSNLTGIAYSTLRAYVKGRFAPTLAQIKKITEVDQFRKYESFLLSSDSDTFDASYEYIPKSEETDEFNDLFRQVCEAGHGDEALKYLRYLAKREDSE